MSMLRYILGIKLFEDQFEQDAHGYLYRKRHKGAPIRVSAQERNDFVAAFRDSALFCIFAMILAVAALLCATAWLEPQSSAAIWIGLVTISALFLSLFVRAWDAPARVLEHRKPEGAPLSSGEGRARMFSRVSYSQLALLTVLGLSLMLNLRGSAPLQPPQVIASTAGAILIAIAAVHAFRKWRYSRNNLTSGQPADRR